MHDNYCKTAARDLYTIKPPRTDCRLSTRLQKLTRDESSWVHVQIVYPFPRGTWKLNNRPDHCTPWRTGLALSVFLSTYGIQNFLSVGGWSFKLPLSLPRPTPSRLPSPHDQTKTTPLNFKAQVSDPPLAPTSHTKDQIFSKPAPRDFQKTQPQIRGCVVELPRAPAKVSSSSDYSKTQLNVTMGEMHHEHWSEMRPAIDAAAATRSVVGNAFCNWNSHGRILIKKLGSTPNFKA